MISGEPLAERMRPRRLEDYVGQSHLVGENAVLGKIIRSQSSLPSIILWGPPGVGKTTLARLIAKSYDSTFYSLSAIQSGVKDVRDIIESCSKQGGLMSKPIVFIDEIHRFSKSQQDSLLGAVERGVFTLIGATTENPSFEVIPALLSRCQVYTLKALSEEELKQIVEDAVKNDAYLKPREIVIEEWEALYRFSSGDARKLLNILDLLANTQTEGETIRITNELTIETLQSNPVRYDKTGEQHYDIVSAFIKSMRGSDPNAALYYLARMMEGGEDPKFIARRMLILASEDIGNANPTALIMANNCFQAVTFIGYPECDLILAQTVIYLSTSAKSNASYTAIRAAQNLVRETGNVEIPLHLRNSPTKLMKELGYGADYQYAHNYLGNFTNQEYLPEELSGTTLYQPGDNKREMEIRGFLKSRWKDKYGY
ncbi:MAG: replication-associated recombination protein A [Bacteroidia bacterium]